MKVSVACPTFEYYGRGVEVLDDMFRTISNQTLKDVEVVVSDHSRTDEIEDYCKKNEHDLNIKYLRNENGRGNPCINTNNAIDNCTGEIIKIFQQDDFLYDTEALEKMYNVRVILLRNGLSVVLLIHVMMDIHSLILCFLDGMIR